jgi:hypothetical protein
MLRKITLLSVIILLTGCVGSLGHREKIVYRCAYRNITTKKMYVVTGRDRFSVLYKAQKACLKGPVEWRCYFDTCEEIPQ